MVNGEADHRSEREAADPVLLHGELTYTCTPEACYEDSDHPRHLYIQF